MSRSRVCAPLTSATIHDGANSGRPRVSRKLAKLALRATDVAVFLPSLLRLRAAARSARESTRHLANDCISSGADFLRSLEHEDRRGPDPEGAGGCKYGACQQGAASMRKASPTQYCVCPRDAAGSSGNVSRTVRRVCSAPLDEFRCYRVVTKVVGDYACARLGHSGVSGLASVLGTIVPGPQPLR